MLNQRLSAARAVRAPLIATEQGIEDALKGVAQLTLAMLDARAVARLPHSAGQVALEFNAELYGAITAARRHAGNMHAELRRELGMLGLTAFGDQFECPPEALEASTALRSVA